MMPLPCFLEYHILVIWHLWQHFKWWFGFDCNSLIDAVMIDALMVLLLRWRQSWRFGFHSWLKVTLREASQSNCCFCLEEDRYFEKDNECFSRCRCCRQMLLGIHTPCAGVLFSCLDVCCHCAPVVAWSCCWSGLPIKRWKCLLWSLVQMQNGIFYKICTLRGNVAKNVYI